MEGLETNAVDERGARALSHHDAEPSAEAEPSLQPEAGMGNDASDDVMREPELGNPMDEDRKELLEEQGEGGETGEAATMRKENSNDGDANAAEEAAAVFEEEPDFEEKEKDWDADEEIGNFEEDDAQGKFDDEGTEQKSPEETQVEANKANEADIGAEAELDGENAEIGEGQEQPEAVQKSGVLLPLARVKRIVKLDPDIKQVSSEALKTIALAAEMFLGSLAVSTAHVTQAGKRSTVKVEDLLQAVKSRRRYKECLGTDLENLRPFDANQAARQEARQAKMKEKARELPPGVKPITSFFKK